MPGIWSEDIPVIRQKRPEEEITLPIDFTPRPQPSDQIAGPPVATVTKEWGPGGELVITGPSLVDGVWTALVTGGAAPSDHLVRVEVDSTSGNHFTARMVVEIRV